MKVKGVSFSKYNVNMDIYNEEKLDLFSFLFIQIILNEKLDKESKFITCLNDLDIKEDLYYLFNNVYYRFIDNKIITCFKDDIENVCLKDIEINSNFVSLLKQGVAPILSGSESKEFVYDYLLNKVVLEKKNFTDSNVVVFELNNDFSDIERLINDNKKGLFNESVNMCLLKDFSADPYYFEFELADENGYYVTSNNKDVIYKSLVNNSLFINDKPLKGEVLTNNVYYSLVYSENDLSEYCKYLFRYDKDREFDVCDNVIYVGFKFGNDFVDLSNGEDYICGKYLLENREFIATFNKSKINISEFKLYLIKNKDRFKVNISNIIDLF